jgi:ribosome biogenesis GTPase A
MFGERYFATRQRLTDVVVGVRKLGEKCGADVATLADESDFLKGLRSPFLFVVCGEVNAGKSTLLNGLFGQEICKMNVLPETETVHWYRWGKEVKTVKTTSTLEERYRPIDFLQDFNIVDTPGTNSIAPGHQPILGERRRGSSSRVCRRSSFRMSLLFFSKLIFGARWILR